MMKRLIHTGSTLRPRSPQQKAEIAEHLREKVWPLLEAGTLQADHRLDLSAREADKAHARMESSAHFGKIVLTI